MLRTRSQVLCKTSHCPSSRWVYFVHFLPQTWNYNFFSRKDQRFSIFSFSFSVQHFKSESSGPDVVAHICNPRNLAAEKRTFGGGSQLGLHTVSKHQNQNNQYINKVKKKKPSLFPEVPVSVGWRAFLVVACRPAVVCPALLLSVPFARQAALP